MELDAKRADLDLQISLLAEHEITCLIRLVQQMAQKLEVQEAQDPGLADLAQDVHPEEVMETMDRREKELHD